MSEDDGTVDCPVHGLKQATFVCRHIVLTLEDKTSRGFWWADDPGNPRPDAWCSACEEKVQSTGGEWNDDSESFAGVSLVCGECYDRAKELNLGKTRKWWQVWR